MPERSQGRYLQIASMKILDWRCGEPPGPFAIELFPTNRCNLECKHCWLRTGDYDRTYQSELSDERVLRLVEEAHELGVRYWIFKGGGEPMARAKLLMATIRRIRELGMNGILHTNGVLLRNQQVDELVALGWDHLYFSLDGPDAATSDSIRTGGFDKVKEVMARFRAGREASGSPLPRMTINCVVTRKNYTKLGRMVEFAHEAGCVGIDFSSLIRFTELCDEFALGPEQHGELKAEARAALTRSEELGVATNLSHFLGEGPAEDAELRDFGPERTEPAGILDALCFKPYTELTIHANGRVGPCCMSQHATSDSLHDMSLRDAWFGPYMQRTRRRFRRNAPMSYCTTCPAASYHLIGEVRRFATRFVERQEKTRTRKNPSPDPARRRA